MKTEIISIGSELTSGQNLDTHAQWLSRRLAEVGIPVGWHSTVADDFDANLDVFRVASQRAKLVIATGGLGPTQDDLTREVLAKLAGVDLVSDAAELAHIEQMFVKRGRVMPERNRVQALVPAGAEPIRNDHGTAPGVWMKHGDTLIVCMPGVPSEMYAMFEEQVRPRLLRLGVGGGVLVQRKINCFGGGESAIEAKLLDLTRRDHVPEVGITASDATISLRILARAANPAEAQALIAPVEKTIRDRLGDFVFGYDEEELQHAVFRLLCAKRKTLATVESLTAGLVANRVGQVPGASEWFLGGLVTYNNRIKHELAGVPTELLEEHGAVSAPVAEAMAAGCRTRLGSDLAVSTTGLAGPGGGTSDKPVGLVYVGLAWDGGVRSQSFNWVGSRTEIQSRTAKLALNMVRLHLQRL